MREALGTRTLLEQFKDFIHKYSFPQADSAIKAQVAGARGIQDVTCYMLEPCLAVNRNLSELHCEYIIDTLKRRLIRKMHCEVVQLALQF